MEQVTETAKMYPEYIQSSDCLIKELLSQNNNGESIYQIAMHFIALWNEHPVFGTGIDNIPM